MRVGYVENKKSELIRKERWRFGGRERKRERERREKDDGGVASIFSFNVRVFVECNHKRAGIRGPCGLCWTLGLQTAEQLLCYWAIICLIPFLLFLLLFS